MKSAAYNATVRRSQNLKTETGTKFTQHMLPAGNSVGDGKIEQLQIGKAAVVTKYDLSDSRHCGESLVSSAHRTHSYIHPGYKRVNEIIFRFKKC